MGWAFDCVTFHMPGGARLPSRLTAVLREEDGAWKIVHAHFSVAVPCDLALEQAGDWLTQLEQGPDAR